MVSKVPDNHGYFRLHLLNLPHDSFIIYRAHHLVFEYLFLLSSFQFADQSNSLENRLQYSAVDLPIVEKINHNLSSWAPRPQHWLYRAQIVFGTLTFRALLAPASPRTFFLVFHTHFLPTSGFSPLRLVRMFHLSSRRVEDSLPPGVRIPAQSENESIKEKQN